VLIDGVLVEVVLLADVVLVELVVVVWAATGPMVRTARKMADTVVRFMSVASVNWVVVDHSTIGGAPRFPPQPNACLSIT